MSYETDTADAMKTARVIRRDKPDVWVPINPGDTLIGTVTRVDAGWSDQKNAFYPILTVAVAQADGYEPEAELKVHGFRSVLEREILRAQPVEGEQVTIRFEGLSTREPRAGQSRAHLYRVDVVGRPVNGPSVYARLTGKNTTPDPPTTDNDLPF